jgi:AcrR family transcriptional regulator/DNA-binding MarR family transcriptional regulator
VRVDGHGTHARVAELQRARLLAAIGPLACELGAGNVTVGHVVERAGVSRRTFYDLFADGEGCLLAAFESALERAAQRAIPAWQGRGPWHERVRAALFELLCLFDEEPVTAGLLVVETLAAGRIGAELRSQALAKLIHAVDEGRHELKGKSELTRLTAEGVVGGALAVLHGRLAHTAGAGRLVELTNPLMSMVVLPYRGAAAARRELQRPLPAPAAASGADELLGPPRSDPFKDAGMRLTYRTMRVLDTIGEHPGLSNRRVGLLAGIADQGQISKLLARLQRLGLIDTGELSHLKGEPNAWRLTVAGRQVVKTIHAHAEAGSAAEGAE